MSQHTSSEAHESVVPTPDAHAREVVRSMDTFRTSLMHGVKVGIRLFGPSILVGLAAPFVFPALRRAIKPAAKGLVQGVTSLVESVKDGASGAREQFSDFMAEAKAEREAEAAKSTPVEKADA
jgi:hypothetical protein